jgi:hypothetical protein
MARKAYHTGRRRGMPIRRPLRRLERLSRWLGHLTAVRIAYPVRWCLRQLVRTTLLTRTVLGTTAAICGALLVATLSEAWVTYRLEQQVSQAQAANAWLRHDASATARQVVWAQAPQTIEDEARARGYVRPGDQPVVIAAGQAAPAMPAPARPARANGGGLTGQWPDWWQLFFGG